MAALALLIPSALFVSARRGAAADPVNLLTALRGDDRLLLGFEHATEDRLAFNPRPIFIPAAGQFGNIHVVGAIGSGKTAAVIKPLLEQVLSKHVGDPARRPALVLLDIKGGMAADVAQIAARHGRNDDVVVLRPGGPTTLNVLGSASPEVEAVRLYEALYADEPDGGHPFYATVARRFLHAALEALDERRGRGQFTLLDVAELLADPDRFDEAMTGSKRRVVQDLCRFFDTVDARERHGLVVGLQSKLALWTSGPFASTFSPVLSTFAGFESLIERGLICVIELPEDQFNAELCRGVAVFLLALFMDQALKRTNPAVEINRSRIVYLVADEAHAVLNDRLARFTAVSRQSRTCVALAHQSMGQIPPRLRSALLANFRTKIALALADAESAELLSLEFGSHEEVRITRSHTHGRRQESRTVSNSTTQARRFDPTRLLLLPQWRAVASVFDGRQGSAPLFVRTAPHFEWGARVEPKWRQNERQRVG